MEKHIHGGAPQQAFQRMGIPQHRIVDFSVNVSPLGPPRILFKKWNSLIGEVLSYPTLNGDGVAEYYIHRFGLDQENILPGNGSAECIYLVPRVLKLKKVAIVTPSFHDYERSCHLCGARIKEIVLSHDGGFAEPDYDTLACNLEEADAILLGNPNNPTNTHISRETVLKLSESYPEKYILVDEAFIQFLDDFQDHTLLHPDYIRKNILVFHSLTKIFDVPGIRLGAVIGHPETIELLKDHKEPWTVNGIAERVAEILIQCQDYEEQLKKLMRKERERFVDELGTVGGLRLFPSRTNYFLAQWQASDNLDDLLRILLSNGFFVRDCRNFRNLSDNYFRFAVRKAPDNVQLISLIKRALKTYF